MLECIVHLKGILFITGWLGKFQQPSRLSVRELTFPLFCFFPSFLLSCRQVGCYKLHLTSCSIVLDVLRVSCYTGGVGVMALCGCECFTAAVSKGQTLCSLGLDEYESRQERPAEKETRVSCLSLTAAFIPFLSCSMKCQTEFFLSEKVTTLTCVKLMQSLTM